MKYIKENILEPRIKTFDERLNDLDNVTDIQGSDGNWDYDRYMTGLYNGLELAKAIMHDNYGDPKYREIVESRAVGYQIFEEKITSEKIMNLKKLPKELKEIAVTCMKEYSRAKKGIVTGLKLHPDLSKKLRDGKLPSGFDMGIDKDGYFVHTHRARSKSYETPSKISIRDIKFIDSTG